MSIQQIAMIRTGGAADVSVTGTARGGFGELLRSYRQSAGLTQEELAHLAQLSPRAIWDLECGRRQRPRRSTVDGLIRALPLDDTRARLLAAAARSALGRQPSRRRKRPMERTPGLPPAVTVSMSPARRRGWTAHLPRPVAGWCSCRPPPLSFRTERRPSPAASRSLPAWTGLRKRSRAGARQ